MPSEAARRLVEALHPWPKTYIQDEIEDPDEPGIFYSVLKFENGIKREV